MELLAQAGRGGNDQAYQMGVLVGIIVATIISAGIPLAVGISRGQPLLGVFGAICAVPAALLLGCLGGLPVAGLFTVIIMAIPTKDSSGRKRSRRRPRYDEDDGPDDYEDRRRRRYDDDDDEDDDRPRRRRRDDD